MPPEGPPPPEGQQPPTTSWWLDVFDGVVLAALIAAIVAAERLDVARATVAMAADAGRPDQAANTTTLAVAWLVVLLAGVGLALRVRHRTLFEMDRIGAVLGAAPAVTARRRLLLKRLSIWAVAAWVAWQLWGIAAVAFEWGTPAREGLHVLALVLALLAIGGAGRQVIGDPGEAWQRASAVRLQLILLALLLALVFVVPLTAAQLVDVLRGWGDQPGTRAVVGIAAALLLGAVCRASSVRLLAPTDTGEPGATRKLVAKVLAVAIAALMVALAILHAWVGAGVCLGVLLVAAGSEWRGSLAVTDRPGSHRLAGTLGVFALATVFVGLVDATVDSFLLPHPWTSANVALLLVALAVGVVLGFLCGDAHRDPDLAPGPEGYRWRDLGYGAAAFALTLVAAWGPVHYASRISFLWALPLLAGAGVLAFRRLGQHGNPEMWTGAGVSLAAAMAIYVEPIRVPRAFGAFGVTLIAAAGLLLVLHGAASWSMRRRPVMPLRGALRDKIPVVTLLALWIAAAAVFSQITKSTAHQARTIHATGGGKLDASVRTWLTREAKASPGEDLPMLLVGASGGGAKAGYWTDLVMDCLLGSGVPSSHGECPAAPGAGTGPARFGRLFLTSSVSGGSIGVYHLLRNVGKATGGEAWVDRAAGPEVLSPVTAWGLFHDLPAFLLGADTDPRDCRHEEGTCRIEADRALVQEAAIAGQHGLAPGDAMTAPIPRNPVAVFNGALDGADGRVLSSPLDLAPPRAPDPSCNAKEKIGEPAAGSIDARDELQPGNDVPLLTAAGLSARFPVVAPAARLGDTTPHGSAPDCNVTSVLPPVRVRDGGYVENTGLLTISELLPRIDSVARHWAAGKRTASGQPLHVQLIVLSIDDDPAVVHPSPQLKEGHSAFGIAKRATPSYFSHLTRDRLSSCQYPDVTYRRISPTPHIGAHAATGWEVSQTSRELDLRQSLSSDLPLPGEPAETLRYLRNVLDGTVPVPHKCTSP